LCLFLKRIYTLISIFSIKQKEKTQLKTNLLYSCETLETCLHQHQHQTNKRSLLKGLHNCWRLNLAGYATLTTPFDSFCSNKPQHRSRSHHLASPTKNIVNNHHPFNQFSVQWSLSNPISVLAREDNNAIH